MRNKIIIAVFILICLGLLPSKVQAETIGCENVSIELQNIELGDKAQETTHAIGGIHFITPTINITWYESSDGHNYTIMDKNSAFNYNIYYKAVLDTSYDELKKRI